MNSDLLQAGLPPANDRMLTTCFVAALIHCIIILGVTFSSPNDAANGGDEAALEVVLVNDQAPSVAKNPNAPYLSERSQLGSGNTLKRERSRIPKSSPMAVDRVGIPDGEGIAAATSGRDTGDDEVVATHGPATKILYFAAADASDQPSQLPLLLEKRPDLGMAANDDGIELRMRGEARTAALDRRGHARIGRRRVPGQLASQDRAGGHDELPGCRAAREALRNAGDRGDDRRRRQAAANRDPPQQRPRGDRRGRHADSEARRAL